MTDLTLQEFSPIFRDLVRALQPPKALDRETERVYWETLRGFSGEVLRQSACVLRRQDRPLWPTSGEWYRLALRLRAETLATEIGAGRECERCRDFGLLRVAYQSGELFDIAVCSCLAGRFYRTAGPALVLARLALDPAHRVGYLEDFNDDVDA
jgi:hypothetical protein